MREQVGKKNQLEEKIRKVNQAKVQIRHQLEELRSTAEPEVQNVQYLVNINRIKLLSLQLFLNTSIFALFSEANKI